MDFEQEEPAQDEVVYRIGELAEEFGLTLRTLRFYETKGLLRPRRVGSLRLYSRRDRARLKLALLGRRFGLPLDEVKDILDLYSPERRNRPQIRAFLARGRRQMEVLNRQRLDIEAAISELQATLDAAEALLAEMRRGFSGSTPVGSKPRQD